MTASLHARGIAIAAALAVLALALGFATLAMNQTASQAAPHVVLPLKDRHRASGSDVAVRRSAANAKTHLAKQKVTTKRLNANLAAALGAGLPRPVAEALAKHPVVVVELWSNQDPVGRLSVGEAEAGATLGGAGFVGVNVDTDGGVAGVLTAALGKLPSAPTALVYARPATLVTTLQGFNDRTSVQQAVSSATSPAAAR